jgi:hypothetical protein
MFVILCLFFIILMLIVQSKFTTLLGLLKSPDISERQYRLLIRLARFTFTLKHIPGRKNVIADLLSRPADESISIPYTVMTLVPTHTLEDEITALQRDT